MKSLILRFTPIYRLCLRCTYGAASRMAPAQQSWPNGVLQNRAEWQRALARGKELKLPLHRAPEKNWDHLAAAEAIAAHFPKTAAVLDAGAEFYSNLLPALLVFGFEHLYGMNLSFADPARRGPIRFLPGDITATRFADGSFDAITCMSVIEHGVPLKPYFEEMYRLLKPGGVLITSTDYYPEPIDTAGQVAYGTQIKIFSRTEAQQLIAMAMEIGFEQTAPVNLEGKERPVRWEACNLDFTFLVFTLRKPDVAQASR